MTHNLPFISEQQKSPMTSMGLFCWRRVRDSVLLAPRSSVWPALTCHWHVIHSRPVRIPDSFMQQKSPMTSMGLFCWRRVRDSNPRRFYPHSISSAAPSTTRTTLHQTGIRFRIPVYYKANAIVLSSQKPYICAAISTISIERRMNSVICSASSG